MTQVQVSYQIDQAIDQFDFSESDFTHSISLLCDDFHDGEIDEHELKEELSEILSNEFGLFGEYLAKALLKEILS